MITDGQAEETAAPRLDAAALREYANGSWRKILTGLGMNLPPTAKQHGPCPACSGKDRFRFDDQEGNGTWFCNQCQPQAGDGFALVQNVKGCTFPDALQLVADALGLHASNGGSARRIIKTYDYTDNAGQLLFQVVRYEPKDFRQRRPNGHCGWIWNLRGIEPVLYKLPYVLKAEHVLILEGEKDVETAYRFGLPNGWAATCNPMGAEKWRESYSAALKGRSTVILPDADAKGEQHAVQVALALRGKAKQVERLTLPDGAKDLSIWVMDRTQSDFHVLLTQAVPWDSKATPHSNLTSDSPAMTTCPALDLSQALVNYTDLMALRIPERPRHVPWLPEGGNVMVFGPRGVGKTFFQLALAVSLTTGTALLKWNIPAPVGVLYLDGEMQLDELRERATALMDTPPVAPLEFLTSQLVYQKCQTDLVLTSEAMRNQVMKILDARPKIRVLLLDNISCLFSGINEDCKQDWEPINAWLIRLRHRGLATVLAHHSGKGGQQRGTSGREDSLDTVIQLTPPAGTDAREGCHFEMHFTKCRSVTGDDVAPIDVSLHSVGDRLQWRYQAVEVSKLEQARKLVADGVDGPTELSEELNINKGYASRILKKLRAEVA